MTAWRGAPTGHVGADEAAGGRGGRRHRPWPVLCVPVVGLPQPSLRKGIRGGIPIISTLHSRSVRVVPSIGSSFCKGQVPLQTSFDPRKSCVQVERGSKGPSIA